MGNTWKPVEATEITDINIIREVIAQIRKPIPPEVYARLAEGQKHLEAVMKPIDPKEKARKWAAIRQKLAEKAKTK